MPLKLSLVSWRRKVMFYDFFTDEIKPREVKIFELPKATQFVRGRTETLRTGFSGI